MFSSLCWSRVDLVICADIIPGLVLTAPCSPTTRSMDKPGLVLCDGGGYYSHADLSHCAAHLAAQLQHASPTVGLVADRSVEMVVGILAILMSGRAYTPLATDLPVARIRLVIEVAGITALALDRRHALWGKTLFEGLDHIVIPSTAPAAEHRPSCGLPLPRGLCAVMSTSGSTGRPKLLGVASDSISHFLEDFNHIAQVTHRSSILGLVSAAFVDHFSTVLLMLQTGCTLVLPALTTILSGALSGVVLEHAVTHIIGTPTMLQLLDPAACGSSVEAVVSSGERLPEQLLHHWMTAATSGDLRFINVYGQTECTSSVCGRVHTKARFVASADAALDIGTAYPSGELYILDRYLHTVAEGEVGELHYSGRLLCSLLDGQQCVVPNPFYSDAARSCSPGMLRTGDLARRGKDGALLLLGRADRRIKLRGVRIDLDELEACILGAPRVIECGVVHFADQIVACCTVAEAPHECKSLAAGPPERCKFFKSARGCDWGSNCRFAHSEPSIQLREGFACSAVRRHCELTLPPYMVPSLFIKIDAMPLSATTQKLDRQQLLRVAMAELDAGLNTPGDESPAPTAVEEEPVLNAGANTSPVEQLRRAWELRVGNSNRASGELNFFEAGGTA